MEVSYKNSITNNCSKLTKKSKNINNLIIYKPKQKSKTKKKKKKTKICRVVLFYSDSSCDESF